MKLLTCLGTGKYDPITYVWSNKKHKTNLFPLAICDWLQPKKIFVLPTNAAKKHENWRKLKERLPNAKAVPIPDGKTESEYWQIFQAISDCVEEKDEFVFDITHGFRCWRFSLRLTCAAQSR